MENRLQMRKRNVDKSKLRKFRIHSAKLTIAQRIDRLTIHLLQKSRRKFSLVTKISRGSQHATIDSATHSQFDQISFAGAITKQSAYKTHNMSTIRIKSPEHSFCVILFTSHSELH